MYCTFHVVWILMQRLFESGGSCTGFLRGMLNEATPFPPGRQDLFDLRYQPECLLILPPCQMAAARGRPRAQEDRFDWSACKIGVPGNLPALPFVLHPI